MDYREDLITFWRVVIVGSDVNINCYDSILAAGTADALVEWMFQTLMKAAQVTLEELGCSSSPGEGSSFAERISWAFREVNRIKNHSPKLTSRIFHSWPALIREVREFNCVGAALLTCQALANLQIESDLAAPPFHLANLVPYEESLERVAFYLDATNSIKERTRLQDIGQSGHIPIVSFDKRIDFFSRAAVVPDRAIVLFVLENTSLVPKLAKDPYFAVKGTLEEKEEAKSLYKRYVDLFGVLRFEAIIHELFPWRDNIDSHPLMREEIVTVDSLMREQGVSMKTPPPTMMS